MKREGLPALEGPSLRGWPSCPPTLTPVCKKGDISLGPRRKGAPRSDCPLRPSPPNPLPRRWLALAAAGDSAEGVGQGIEKVQANPVPPALAPDFGERARPAELS